MTRRVSGRRLPLTASWLYSCAHPEHIQPATYAVRIIDAGRPGSAQLLCSECVLHLWQYMDEQHPEMKLQVRPLT